MTAGWAATNTLREALAIAWPEGDHAEPNVYTEALSKIALVEAALDAAEPMANLPWPLSFDERQEWIVAQNRMREALRAVREGK